MFVVPLFGVPTLSSRLFTGLTASFCSCHTPIRRVCGFFLFLVCVLQPLFLSWTNVTTNGFPNTDFHLITSNIQSSTSSYGSLLSCILYSLLFSPSHPSLRSFSQLFIPCILYFRRSKPVSILPSPQGSEAPRV